jgi:hypothetical protein
VALLTVGVGNGLIVIVPLAVAEHVLTSVAVTV